MNAPENSVSYRIIADLLESRTGQQIDQSRRWRIPTTLAGIFRERGISNVDQLVCLLASPGEEKLADEVVEALLNNETYFFRDRAMFDQLSTLVLPALARDRAMRKRISVWCAGCSTGQEPLSIAMLFRSQSSLWDGWTIDILGTDISQKAINTARSGIYSQFEIQRGLGVSQMLSSFTETPDGWKVDAGLRGMIRYREQNLLDAMDMPGRFDLVLCRNVLLYFDHATRSRAIERIRDTMAEDGWLMLGAGESVSQLTQRLQLVPDTIGLHRPVSIAPKKGRIKCN